MIVLDGVNWPLLLGPLAYFITVGGLLDGYFVFRWLQLPRFGIAVGEALLANLFSLIMGFVAWPYIFPNGFDYAELSMLSYGMLWVVTVVSEAFVLALFNRRKPRVRIVGASVSMNLVSFVLLYGFFWWMN